MRVFLSIVCPQLSFFSLSVKLGPSVSATRRGGTRRVNFKWFPVMATIDTGAAISVVSEKVLQTLKLEDPNFSWDITPWIGNPIAMAN